MNSPPVYRFRVALQHVSPKIWRRIEVPADRSLADLQGVIQIVMGWTSTSTDSAFAITSWGQRVLAGL